MVGYGGSSAGSYLADPTSPIYSHCAVITLCRSASVVVTRILRVDHCYCSQVLTTDSCDEPVVIVLGKSYIGLLLRGDNVIATL